MSMNRIGATSDRALVLSTQRGFTLLEILIAIVVLSIGLLGLAGLQTLSLQSNQSASQVSQATFLAQDIFERMRSNREAAHDGQYNIDFGDRAGDLSGSGVVNADRQQWLAQIERALPGVTSDDCNGEGACGARVRWDSNSRTAEITIRWINERRDVDDDRRFVSFRTETSI